MLWVTVTFAKMISYAMINHNLRMNKKAGKPAENYPKNLTLGSILKL